MGILYWIHRINCVEIIVNAAAERSVKDTTTHPPTSTAAVAATPTHIAVVPSSAAVAASSASAPRYQSMTGGPVATGNKSPTPGESVAKQTMCL